MQLSDCKILLTGSKGCLGTRLKGALIASGVSKAVYFNQKLGSDLLNQKSLKQACRECNVTIHLAGLAHPGLASVEKYVWTNVVGTLSAVEEAIRAGHSRFVFVSSGAVYGWDLPKPPDLVPPIDENQRLASEAIEPYTTSKIVAEQLVTLYANARLIEVVVLRLAPIWNRDQAGDPRFFRSALSPEIAIEAILNSLQLEMRQAVAIYNVADPDRRGDYAIDRALADGIVPNALPWGTRAGSSRSTR